MAYAGCLFVSVAVVFHDQLRSGFTAVFGDRFDGLIETAILEHWSNVWRGLAPWQTPFYFAPYTGTLAYNDGLLLYGAPYAAFRQLGADPFLASELVNIVIRGLGFVAMHWLLHRILRLAPAWSLLGAVLFTLACNSATHADHAQWLTVALVPLFAGLVWRAVEAFDAAAYRRFQRWAAAASLLMGAWLLTAYYMAWFTLFLLAWVGLLTILTDPGNTLRRLRALTRPASLHLVAALALLQLAVAPFLWLYLPKARATGMHPRAEIFYYTTNLLDLVHVAPGNPLLSAPDRLIQATLRPHGPDGIEHMTGLGLLLFGLFVGACVTLWRSRAVSRAAPANARSVALIAAAAVIVWLLTIRFGAWSPWFWVDALVPGARGLRVVVRYQLVASAAVIPVVMWALSRSRLPAAVLALLAAGLVLEEINLRLPTNLDRPQEMAQLHAVPPPPPECRASFVSHARAAVPDTPLSALDAIYSHNVDAMLLSEWLRLPTINGYSTFNPPDWNFVGPERPDYLARVQAYARAHAIGGLCALDLRGPSWSAGPVIP